MRIVAGSLRHRVIEMTNLETTRETQDKVRQAIYNMIGPYFDGGICLDLFTGSGAMAIEAYSRGVSKIYLNDLNKQALDVAKKNCQTLGIKDAYFSNMDYIEFIKSTNVKFDLIILDPPYKMNDIGAILSLCKDITNNNGLIVFEMARESNTDFNIEGLFEIKNKPYGIKKVVVYRKEA